MGKRKAKTPASKHAAKRFGERWSGSGDVEELSLRARHYGIATLQLPDGCKLKEFMLSKEKACGKKLKLIDGYVAIFSNSKRLITLYRLSDEYREEYEGVRAILEQNKASYKKDRAKKSWKERKGR